MIAKNTNKDKICGAPSGVRMVDASLAVSDASGHVDSDAQGFRCDICDRTFGTKIGLGQHKRRAHYVEYNAQLVDSSKSRNRRWTDEERLILAGKEVEAIQSGYTGSLDRFLASKFLGRTMAGIKGQRRTPAYKDVLARVQNAADLEHQVRNLNSAILHDEENIVDLPGWISGDPIKKILHKEIRNAISFLKYRTEFKAKMLRGAAETALRTRGLSCRMMEWLNTVTSRYRVDCTGSSGISHTQRPICGGKKVQRKDEFARVQRLFRRRPKLAARHVLEGPKNTSNGPTSEEMFKFWGKIYENKDDGNINHNLTSVSTQENGLTQPSEEACKLWAPITVDEIKASELPRGTAPGPDGVSVTQWRVIPRYLRAIFYNLLLYKGNIDQNLANARTVFIPKTDDPRNPGDFRPIGVQCVTLRQYHSILAKRLRAFRSYDERQKAFCNSDGTAENILLLKSVLDDAQQSQNELHIASIDLVKAFDSVTHDSILNVMRKIGCPGLFIKHMKNVYEKASTTLTYKQKNSKVNFTKGVLQGDPLSPGWFNYTIDGALENINDNVGYSLNGKTISCIAFADDIVLLSSTVAGLQHNLDKLTEALGCYGLEVNIRKTNVLSIVPVGKEKKISIPTDSLFNIKGTCLKQIGVLDEWKYLGIHFRGPKVCSKTSDLSINMAKVGKAPLKPQQKLFLLKYFVLPKYVHSMVLGGIGKVALASLDVLTRNSVREWLKLPHDTPVPYFHAPVKSGGLGLPCLSIDVARMRLQRMNRFINTESSTANAVSRSGFYDVCKSECFRVLEAIGFAGEVNKFDIFKYWETELEKRIDTADLLQSKHCSESNSWILSKSNWLSGRDYVHSHQIRVGSLPSLARRSRGCDGELNCRAGCSQSETNYHVIQQCCRTKGGRSLRHNLIVDILHSEFSRDFVVHKEPHIKTFEGLRKPDLILTDGSTAMVIDVHIVHGGNMEADRSDKVNKYRNVPYISELICDKYRMKEVVFEAVTMSYKGVFEKASSELLSKLNVRKATLSRMATSVLRGSWLNWFSFNKTYWSRNA